MEKAREALHPLSPALTRRIIVAAFVLLVFYNLLLSLTSLTEGRYLTRLHRLPPHAAQITQRCQALTLQAGPPPDFHRRSESDRYVDGTRPVLIQRAKIWTGGKNGTEVVHGDILVDKGLFKSVGHISRETLSALGDDLIVIDAKDAWVTPGIVDIHSHLGDDSAPELDGSSDTNSFKSTAQPWLRSLDGLNTHDESYPLSIAGGVTTSLILPGSANAIGGQAFPIKLRQTLEGTPTSMLLEPPYNINNSSPRLDLSPRWRHMKHACGENPSRIYKATRMDTYWAFREAYNHATQVKVKQDEYCSAALAGRWEDLGEFPEDLQWEALVDVIRGRVKVNVHCYEALDIDALVRISNEFKFPISVFHHASEAYLVPDMIKKAYGSVPAIALFATNGHYKREAYRSSEFAPRILARNNLTVLMKSDHPVLNSRYLIYEAQQAYFYGLPENLAIGSVTSNSAKAMGMDHRIGYIREGWDADLVIWDSHPLALGATPTQVLIDGIPQLEPAYVKQKPSAFQMTPEVPDFDKEAKEAVIYEGLPPLTPNRSRSDTTVFTNVKSVYTVASGNVKATFPATASSPGVVVVQNGTIVCSGLQTFCLTVAGESEPHFIDLEGGSISPGFISFGSPLGLEHINQEPSTNDGMVYDPILEDVPDILGGKNDLVRAVDGLMYGSRDALLAYRSGVTSGITAPSHNNFLSGLGVFFSLGAAHKLEEGAVIQEVTAVHVSVRHFPKPSVSTQIAALRQVLTCPSNDACPRWFDLVKKGEIPLVVEAHSADIIATLILLKKEVEGESGQPIKLTVTGASEAHLLAKELATAGIGVILNPPRPFPYHWEDHRILPGPPLTEESAIVKLTSHGVIVGIGCEEIWSARNLRFDVGWAAIEASGSITKEQAMALGTVNVARLLGAKGGEDGDLVAWRGGDLFEMKSRAVAVISPRQELVHIW